jgi:hypothetical protein
MKQKIVTRSSSGSVLQEETLVDQALRLDQELREKTKQLDALKEQIREKAMETGVKEIQGINGDVKFSDAVEWTIDTRSFLEWAKKNKKQDSAVHMLKVSVSDAKKYLGENAMLEFAEKQVKEYARMRLIPRPTP